jgi:hypothetical protein
MARTYWPTTEGCFAVSEHANSSSGTKDPSSAVEKYPSEGNEAFAAAWCAPCQVKVNRPFRNPHVLVYDDLTIHRCTSVVVENAADLRPALRCPVCNGQIGADVEFEEPDFYRSRDQRPDWHVDGFYCRNKDCDAVWDANGEPMHAKPR